MKKTHQSSIAKILKSRLSRQFLFIVLGVITSIFVVLYFYSVPLIQQKIFEIERNSSRIALNNVFEISNRMYANVEQFQQQTLESRKQKLKVAVSLSAAYIRYSIRSEMEQGMTFNQATEKALIGLREFIYGENDYIWVSDYSGTLISHPDPRFQNKLSSEVHSIVDKTIKDGEGFYEYKWNRISGIDKKEKVSYVKDFPEWQFVIGSGLYLDDLAKETQERKEIAFKELRQALSEITIAKTGYFYIFNSNKYMLVHPNSNIEGTYFNDLKNGLTGAFIADELIKVANTGNELKYLWDKPDDPGNYIYEKLSLVRYLPEFDWYISSSVYLDELRSSSVILRNRLINLAGLTMLAAIFLSFFFVNRVTRPLESLADTALKVSKGDYTAKSAISSDDEVGILARSFDGMVEKLKTNIDTLDIKVQTRTDELSKANEQAQRMSAVGQLAGGLAHDFNNLLSIILGNLLLARDRHKDIEGLDNFITPAIRASRRGADITQRLLAFSRKQSLQPKTVLLDQLFKDTIQLLKSSLPANISLSYKTTSKDLKVFVDPGNLESVLVNLAINARDAMPMIKQGSLSYKTSLVVFKKKQKTYDEIVKPGSYVKIVAKDTGSGFSDASLERAFEPFYTTKGDTNNSGLGLSMVYGFVKQSNGFIRIVSEKDKGSCITILLPEKLESEHDFEEKYDSSNALTWASGKLLLLVEDNDDVRVVVREQLIELGINVIEARDTHEAQQLIESLDNLDGMLTDSILDGSNEGQKLAELFYNKNKQSVILLMSGYSDGTNIVLDSHIQFPFLRKPFDTEDLKQGLWRACKKVHKEKVETIIETK